MRSSDGEGRSIRSDALYPGGEWEVPVTRNAKITPVNEGGGGAGAGGPPLRDHLWQGPPLPVTLRLIHPPPKMTQGVMTTLTPLHRLSTASLSGVVRAFAYHRYFRFFLSLFFSTPLNEFFQIQPYLSLISIVGFAIFAILTLGAPAVGMDSAIHLAPEI